MSEKRIINVSPHLLMDSIACETRAYIRHVKGFTTKGDAIKAVAGQAIHKAFDVLMEPNRALPQADAIALLAVNAFHQIYDPAYARLAPEFLEPALTPTNLERLLKRWIQMHPPALLPWKRVLMVEEAFTSRVYTFGDVEVRLIVRPDLIVEDHNGMVRWVDTKTTGSRIEDERWRKTLRMSLQTKLYTDAVVQRFGEKAVYGGWINAMEIGKLPNTTPPPLKKDGTPGTPRKCQLHKRPYAECSDEHAKSDMIECLHQAEMVERAVKDAERAMEVFALHTNNETLVVPELNMDGGANGGCRFCPMVDYCDSGRPGRDGALESFFVYEPWEIETGRRAA